MSAFVFLRAEWWIDQAAYRAAQVKRAVKTARRRQAPRTVHPARAHIHESRNLGERAADAVAAGLGSWWFLGAQTTIILLWIALNVAAIVRHWDPYPFILLNLLFSTQAAYAAPILQLSGNRQAAKDRARDDLEAREVEQLTVMNQQQLEILMLLRKLVDESTEEGGGEAA